MTLLAILFLKLQLAASEAILGLVEECDHLAGARPTQLSIYDRQDSSVKSLEKPGVRSISVRGFNLTIVALVYHFIRSLRFFDCGIELCEGVD